MFSAFTIYLKVLITLAEISDRQINLIKKLDSSKADCWAFLFEKYRNKL